jgi:hypothetical protein
VRRRNRKHWRKAPQARAKHEKCATKWCRNKRAEKITVYKRLDGTVGRSTAFLRHCWKCRSKMLKERHPATYVLRMLRQSARKRKLPFTITLAEFKLFCARTGYLARRGNQPGDLTVDRVDWNEGYHLWNLRVLTHRENSEQGGDNTPRELRGCADDDGLAAVYNPPVSEDEPF